MCVSSFVCLCEHVRVFEHVYLYVYLYMLLYSYVNLCIYTSSRLPSGSLHFAACFAHQSKKVNVHNCRVEPGLVQNDTLLFFLLYYTGEKECGAHSLFSCIYTGDK